ncbi:MAG: type IV secretion system protein VirB10, partial [Steroidobacteraceae bacterium]
MSAPTPGEEEPPERESERKSGSAHGASSPPGFIERGIAAAYRARSFESRAGGFLSLGVVCILGAGLLAWYYGAALERPAHAAEVARGLAASRAQAEMPLPPLLPIAPATRPKPSSPPGPTGAPASAPAQSSPLLDVNAASSAAGVPTTLSPWLRAFAPSASARHSPNKNSHGSALERRLAGPAFATRSGSGAAADEASPAPPGAEAASAMESPLVAEASTVAESSRRGAPSAEAAGGAAGELAKFLVPAVTPAVAAQVLPTRTLLLPKGAFIDCTLETAIDSTLPGMTTCITATDTFGADGKVVLLERGSKLVGETRGEVEQGSSRIFVVWTEARTPTGVVIPLASPGTDELGRSGLPGTVNRHFLQRFGAALLISIIDAGAQVAATSGSGTVIYSPTASQNVVSGVLTDTLRIPPTVVKNQGDRIQVLVARDLDFRSVYEL